MAPSFLVSGIVVVVASLLDRQPEDKAERAREDLRVAAG
jgi:hypothetical protein